MDDNENNLLDLSSASDEDFSKRFEEIINNTGSNVTVSDGNDIAQSSSEETITENNDVPTNLEKETLPVEKVNTEETVDTNTVKEPETTEDFNSLSDDEKKLAFDFLQVLHKKKINASGSQISFDNPSEAVSLIQKGADYTKKTQALASQKHIIDFLEKNQITKDKLPFVKDLLQGNPEAIKKLIKDNNFDLQSQEDFEETDHNYQEQQFPEANPVEQEIQSIIETIPLTEDGKSLLSLLQSSDFDIQSKQMIAQNPQYLVGLKETVDNNQFNAISEKVEELTLKGVLPNSIPYLQRYATVYKNFFAVEKEKTETPKTEIKPKPVKTEPIPPKVNQDLKQVVDASAKTNPSNSEGEATDEEVNEKLRKLSLQDPKKFSEVFSSMF